MKKEHDQKIEEKKKEFTYRGKTMEELKSIDVREFSRFLKSRQRRYVLKNFQEVEEFVTESKRKNANGKKIRTHKRDLIIVPSMVGMNIQIYNGNVFVPVEITREMLGHRLGEFAITRGKIKHSKAGIGATKGTKHQSKK